MTHLEEKKTSKSLLDVAGLRERNQYRVQQLACVHRTHIELAASPMRRARSTTELNAHEH
jgi:hypothetical protein